jgi:SAM-dependent methyltransferase
MPSTAASPGKRELLARALALRAAGRLYPLDDTALEDAFRGSIDRFCDIALRLHGARRVLDVGAGPGLLLSLLHELGHECHALDLVDRPAEFPAIYGKGIRFALCNVEADPLPYADQSFDAVVCCQVLEHFSHSHLPAVREMRRVLRPGGLLEIDVPNVACYRNRARLLRGKHITFDYGEHYLRAEPIHYKGLAYYPLRHNREFTRDELAHLLESAGFERYEVDYLRSRRHREGLERVRTVGTALKDLVPSLRKSLIAFALR